MRDTITQSGAGGPDLVESPGDGAPAKQEYGLSNAEMELNGYMFCPLDYMVI